MLDSFNIQYVTDEKGNKTAVQIPFQEWVKLCKELATFLEGRKLKSKLKKALKDVQQIQSGKQEKVTLRDFLDKSQ